MGYPVLKNKNKNTNIQTNRKEIRIRAQFPQDVSLSFHFGGSKLSTVTLHKLQNWGWGDRALD